MRQLLASKVSGTLVGLWLLVPEHLRLGTWDLVRAWAAQPSGHVAPHLALQLIHEAALGVTGIRQSRTLSQKGFELANGLPYVAADRPIHDLLDAHTVAQAQELQVALGLVRRARGHFAGRLLAIDPHRIPSYSQRQMRRHRSNHKEERRAGKCAQTFFALDADTRQPVCLLTGTASRTATEAALELLPLAERILPAHDRPTLVLADSEHFTLELLDQVRAWQRWALLVPMPQQPYYRRQWESLPPDAFRPQWAGLATACRSFVRGPGRPPLSQWVQRCGERPADYHFKGFLCTDDRRDQVESLIVDFPKRWHIEEFFHDHQALGWQRAGTLNLHIRYGQMSFALFAQAALDQLRQRLGQPFCQWDASHFAKQCLAAWDGDIRVHRDTIVVTYYNAPEAERLRSHFERLPDRLQAEGVDPRIPWLYNFKLDFRFR